MFKVITGTLQANHNTMQITENIIENSYIYEVYVNSTSDVIPQSIDVSGHTLTVTFDSSPTNNVVCKILMFDEYISSSDILYLDGVQGSTVKTVLDGIADELQDFNIGLTTITTKVNNIDSRIPTDTVLGGVLYHATTGNTWKKLDASNLDYDNNSTIYSAMGDIDDLTTTSKNIVGAINEVKSTSGGDIYSTNEILIGTWIDGKPLYRKVFSNLTSGTQTGVTKTLVSINDLPNIDTLIKLNGFINPTGLFTHDNGNSFILWYNANSGLNMRVDIASYLNQPCTIWIDYTKN